MSRCFMWALATRMKPPNGPSLRDYPIKKHYGKPSD
jgi:hypothetical protein